MVLIPASSRQLQLLNLGSWGPPLLGSGSLYSILSPTDLNFLSPGLYKNLTFIYFLRASQFRTQFNPSTVKVAPDLLISSTGCTYYLHWYISSFDSLAGSEVNMQHKYFYRTRIILNRFIWPMDGTLTVGVELGVMAVKRCFTHFRSKKTGISPSV